MALRQATILALYSTSCWCLHNLLLVHYYDECRTTFLSFIFPESAYCSLVNASLQTLRCSPLVVAAPMLLSQNFTSKYFLGKHQKDATEEEETRQ
jgi:hypothetical protein